MKNQTTTYAALIATLLAASSHAATAPSSPTYSMIITTAQGAGAYNSTLSGTQVYTFDNLPMGVSKDVSWNGVGTFDQVDVNKADVYGGAVDAQFKNGSPYAQVGSSTIKTTTLTLNSPSSYFGFYWSAGDPANDLKFYSGKNLVADFTTANLMNMLPNTYNGNPNPAFKNAKGGPGNQLADKAEKFGFINFLGGTGTSWDKIVFTNLKTSGFESDNYTTRLSGWNPAIDGLPGTPVVDVTTKNGVSSVATISNVAFDGKAVTVTTSSASSKTSTTSTFFTPAIDNSGKIKTSWKVTGIGITSPEPSSILTFAFLGGLVFILRRKITVNSKNLMESAAF